MMVRGQFPDLFGETALPTVGKKKNHMAKHPGFNAMRGGHSAAHPGFAAVQAKIAAQRGVSMESAGAMLASSTRHASASAKKRNPRLNRVK